MSHALHETQGRPTEGPMDAGELLQGESAMTNDDIWPERSAQPHPVPCRLPRRRSWPGAWAWPHRGPPPTPPATRSPRRWAPTRTPARSPSRTRPSTSSRTRCRRARPAACESAVYQGDVNVNRGGVQGAPTTITSYPGERATVVGRFRVADAGQLRHGHEPRPRRAQRGRTCRARRSTAITSRSPPTTSRTTTR